MGSAKRGRGRSSRKSYKSHGRHGRDVSATAATTTDDDDDDDVDLSAVTKLLEPTVLGETVDGIVVDLEPTFRNLEVIDRFDCAKLYICRVSAKDFGSLTEDEASLRALFDGQEQINLTSAMSTFQLAARLGLVTGDESACARRYTKCGHDFTHDNVLKNLV